MMTFSKREAFKVGWQRFKERPFFLIGLFLITTIISAFIGGFAESVNEGVLGFAVGIFDFVVQMLISMGMTLVILRVHDEVATDYGDLLEPLQLFWKYLAMTVLVLVVVLIGLLLLVVPGIIAGIALSLAPYLVIDRGLGPVEAMKESIRLTNGHKWNLFVFGVLMFGFNVAGALLLGIGLFVTIPVSAVAGAYMYRWITNPPTEEGVRVSALSKVLSAVVVTGLFGAIIAVIMLLGLSATVPATADGRDELRRFDLREIQLAASLYRDNFGSYPETQEALAPTFITTLPVDPLTGEAYLYSSFDAGADFEVCALLEAEYEDAPGGIYCEFGTSTL